MMDVAGGVDRAPGAEVGIRDWRADDYRLLRRWIDDPLTAGGFASPAPAHSDEDVRRIVAGESPGHERLAITAGDRVIGEIQSWGPGRLPAGVFGMGITIWDPADRGKGYGTRAQALLVRQLFEEREARRVEAGTHPDNVRERRSLEAVGFVAEGTLRDYFDFDDGGGDLVLYAMTRTDWERARGRWT